MTLEDFRRLVLRISLAAPLGAAKAAKPKRKVAVRPRKPARPVAMRPA